MTQCSPPFYLSSLLVKHDLADFGSLQFGLTVVENISLGTCLPLTLYNSTLPSPLNITEHLEGNGKLQSNVIAM